MAIELSKDQVDILGRPNFACVQITNLLIKNGVYAAGPRKAEYEQAVCIHWMLQLMEAHGDNWKSEADKLLGQYVKQQGGAE